MAMAEVSIVPVGTGSPSVSSYVARCLDVLEASGLSYRLNPMGTVIEGELDRILEAVRKMHESALAAGAARVLTNIKIDDRTDKKLTIDGKIEAVRRKRGR